DRLSLSSSAFSSAYDLVFEEAPTGAPHSRQNLACEGLSCWHRGHVMPGPPSGRVGGRSEQWAETNRSRLVWSRTRSHGSRLGTASPCHLSSVVRCSPRRQRGRHSDCVTP